MRTTIHFVMFSAEITRGKGYPPILTEEERSQMIRAIKWVDEVCRSFSSRKKIKRKCKQIGVVDAQRMI